MKRSIASVSDFAEYVNENLIKNYYIPFKYGKIVAHQVSEVS